MGYITKEGLEHLKEYEYKSGGMTWFDEKVNYFWEFIVKFMPKGMAPNLMTFIGWCCILASYLNMLRYDITFDHDIPRWCFFFATICIFAFVTLDAIDGKQARRNNGGSPLGQLFDHGCDSYTMTFLMLGICEALQIEKNAVCMLFITTQIMFWTANWSENHTGVLSTRVGQIGVTEGQHLCMLVHILTGIYGQRMWQIKPINFLPQQFLNYAKSHVFITKMLSITLGTTLVYIFSALVLLMAFVMFFRTLPQAKSKFEAASQYLSSMLLVIMEIAWSRTKLYDHYSGLVLVNFGFLASLILCKLIICTVTKVFRYSILDESAKVPFLTFAVHALHNCSALPGCRSL